MAAPIPTAWCGDQTMAALGQVTTLIPLVAHTWQMDDPTELHRNGQSWRTTVSTVPTCPSSYVHVEQITINNTCEVEDMESGLESCFN